MKRRQLITAIGGLAAGTSLTLGSGAFTSVSADRGLEVETVGDNDALLRLKQLGAGGRSIEDGSSEKVKFRFPSFGERLDGLGLGSDSVYEFDRDSKESDESNPDEGLLRISNQGTQLVQVYSQFETDSELEVEIYDVTDPDETALRDDPVELSTGAHVDVGFRIRTFGAETGRFNETLTIVADQPDPG